MHPVLPHNAAKKSLRPQCPKKALVSVQWKGVLWMKGQAPYNMTNVIPSFVLEVFGCAPCAK